MKKNKKILICPLDWGIGHASRCIPVIEKLIKKNTEVIIAASGRSGVFLKSSFPGLRFIDFPGLTVEYPQKGPMLMKMSRSFPKFLREINRENNMLKSIVDQYDIDCIISDNRFGLWHETTFCVYLTHQVNIRPAPGLPFFGGLLRNMHRKYINRYDMCWIPDYEGDQNLSGSLSHPAMGIPEVRWIGPLSRFSGMQPAENNKDIDVLCIISGPEPQRTVFENMLYEQIKGSKYSAVFILGKPETNREYSVNDKISAFGHLSTDEMLDYIGRSRHIVCRPGYSSIMDLISLGRRAIFVPTPGQTEQAYLAARMMDKGWYYSEKQSRFDLERALQRSEEFPGTMVNDQGELLERAINEMISHI